MHSSRRILAGTLLLGSLFAATICASGSARRDRTTVWLLTKEGQQIEGETEFSSLQIEADGKTRDLGLGEILSIESASAASETERARISTDLAAVSANTDKKACDAAVAELTDIGLPALSPLLATYKDTDRHEPQPLIRLLARIMPGYADRLDRTLDMVRLANGETLRGHVTGGDLKIAETGRTETIPFGTLRRLAVRRRTIDKTFDVDALRHCTPLEFLDTGVGVSQASRIEETAQGLVRLSFDIDGWASDADGIKVPGPNYKTNLVDGYPFGSLVGRVGPSGLRWLAGHHVQKSAFQRGRLYFAVNDNGHWQNNVGSFRVRLHATDSYDLGDPQ
jgi:hypothetical protein